MNKARKPRVKLSNTFKTYRLMNISLIISIQILKQSIISAKTKNEALRLRFQTT